MLNLSVVALSSALLFVGQLADDVSKALGVSPSRFLVHKLSTERPGIRAHLTIFESRAAGSGIPGIEPHAANQLARELIAQVSRLKFLA